MPFDNYPDTDIYQPAGLSGNYTHCGTPFWAAPEIIRHNTYGVKADIYSFGIVLWELVAREDPYTGIPSVQVPFMVTEEQLRPKVPSFCDADFLKLMTECWDDDPEKRPEWTEIQGKLKQIYVDTLRRQMKEKEDLSHLIKHEAKRRLTMDMQKVEENKALIFNSVKDDPAETGAGADRKKSPDYYSRRIERVDKSVGSGIHQFLPHSQRLAMQKEEVIGEEENSN